MSWATTFSTATPTPRGLECTDRNMADWDESQEQGSRGEANTFASFLLMPLDDFRAQIKGRSIDIDVMTELADRYAVSLTAAILKWMTITDKRAMIVVGKDGFIDWAWSSEPLLKSGVFYRARQDVIELPPASLAAQEVDWDTGRHGHHHPAGVWAGSEPVHEMTVFSPGERDVDFAAALSRPCAVAVGDGRAGGRADARHVRQVHGRRQRADSRPDTV